MLSLDFLESIPQEMLSEEAKKLSAEEIAQLVEWLTLKEDKPRYQAFLLLKQRSAVDASVYPYWDMLRSKLNNDNSYQRSIGLMLIAENVRWATSGERKEGLEDYLKLLQDEKPITVRQCIQALPVILEYAPELWNPISDRLVSLSFTDYKETMRKLILMDALNVLIMINRKKHNTRIENFISEALTGEILDKKSRKQIEAQL